MVGCVQVEAGGVEDVAQRLGLEVDGDEGECSWLGKLKSTTR